MRRSIRTTLAPLVLPLALLGGVTFATTSAAAAIVRTASTAQARIHIPSMTCSNHSCATTVYLALIHLPGVTGVHIDEGTQDVTVRYLPGRNQPARFLQAVRNAGYPGTLVTTRRN